MDEQTARNIAVLLNEVLDVDANVMEPEAGSRYVVEVHGEWGDLLFVIQRAEVATPPATTSSRDPVNPDGGSLALTALRHWGLNKVEEAR